MATTPTLLHDLSPGQRPAELLAHLATQHKWATALPTDIVWLSARLDPADAGEFFHIHAPLWSQLSCGTGRIDRTAETIQDHQRADSGRRASEWPDLQADIDLIVQIARNFDPSKCGQLIIGTGDVARGPHMVLDGNHRLVAVALRSAVGTPVGTTGIDVILAHSPTQPLRGW